MSQIICRIQDFLRLESSAGFLLILAALLALAANNTALSPFYDTLLATPMAIQIGALEIQKPLLLWINDGLMAVFFFLVGLEIKREVLQGELSSLDKASLPIIAAIGGMAAPALVYLSFNFGNPDTVNGWAIPAATDIAFALGMLALIGARAPVSLKIFLLAVAIIDDLGAIAIIALFYTADLSMTALGYGLAGIGGLILLNLFGVKRLAPYLLIGAFVWVCVLKSGVHATMAGVITALLIPMHGRREGDQSPLHKIEHGLHPWVAFMVLPLFAFANAGVSFDGLSVSDVFTPLPLGIALGLVLGKPLGVMLFSVVAVRLGAARLPEGVTWMQLAGVACLTGIGFTMSLFIGGLAFSDAEQINAVRLGVITGSVISAALGLALLRIALAGREKENAPALVQQPA